MVVSTSGSSGIAGSVDKRTPGDKGAPMPADRQQARAYALLGLVMLLWAGNSIVGRAVRNDVGPFVLSFVRWAGASLVLAPFALGPLRRDWAVLRRSWPIVLVLGLTGVAAFNAIM
jgi:drug/metabolite transporter (DMT)-like permease